MQPEPVANWYLNLYIILKKFGFHSTLCIISIILASENKLSFLTNTWIKNLYLYGVHTSYPLHIIPIDRNWSDPIYDNLKNLTGEDLLDLVYEMAPKPSEIFYHVIWIGEYLDVDSAFEMGMTDLGT